MHSTLDRLRRNSINLRHLLEVLDRQLRALQRGHAPDYPLMRDILYYLSRMPNRCQYRCEDMVYERLLRRWPDVAASLKRLPAVRQHLSDRGHRQLALTEAVLDEATVSRSSLYALGRDFVGAYRTHLRRVEQALYAPAENILTAADWLVIETELHWRDDPLGGEQVEAQYQNLQDRIAVEMAACRRDDSGLELCDACAAA